MRVCHVITKPELGGAQFTTLSILSNLPKDKYDISVITSPEGMLASEFSNIKNATAYFSPSLNRPINPIADIIALIDIYQIYRSQKFDIIHTHSSKAGILGRWAAWFAKVPRIIHTAHGWPFNNYQNVILKWLFILIERLTARFTTKIICVSNKDIERGLRYKIAPRDKFELIRYGISLAEFKGSSNNNGQKRRELGIDNDDPIVGMIACLKPQKAPLDYIKACGDIYKNMPNINFLLVGDGVLKKKCQRFLVKTPLNGRFILTGWRRDISEILDILDVAVLTSKWEGMPITIIEALCKGLPVVVSDTGGVKEIVKHGVSGLITRPGSYKEISESVLGILNDTETFSKIKKNASLSIDNSFSLRNMLYHIDRLYREGLT